MEKKDMEGSKLNLDENEKILYKTKEIVKKKFSSIGYGLLAGGILVFIWYIIIISISIQHRNSPIMWLILFIPFFLSFFGILILNLYFKHKRTILYITSRNIIKYTEKGRFNLNPHLIMIELNSIDHIICWVNSMEIVPKRQNKIPYYNGSENDLVPDKRISHMNILLEEDKGQKVNEEIRKLLVQIVPMVEHPNNLVGIFLNAQDHNLRKV